MELLTLFKREGTVDPILIKKQTRKLQSGVVPRRLFIPALQ
jgi:hypothetical protein